MSDGCTHPECIQKNQALLGSALSPKSKEWMHRIRADALAIAVAEEAGRVKPSHYSDAIENLYEAEEFKRLFFPDFYTGGIEELETLYSELGH